MPLPWTELLFVFITDRVHC